jgi:hypothetical protein
LKKGGASKEDAIIELDHNYFCGIVDTYQRIDWKKENWAFGCDFLGQDLSNAKTQQKDCKQTCSSTQGCTHYTWTTYIGGTCWMKNGGASKEDAFKISDENSVCGLVDAVNLS